MPSKKCKSRSQTQRFELELESRGMPLPGTNAETTENRKIHIMPSTPSHLLDGKRHKNDRSRIPPQRWDYPGETAKIKMNEGWTSLHHTAMVYSLNCYLALAEVVHSNS